jgi:hypothetical protein
LLLLCGGAVQQAGWWSLYGDLGLWCGLIGGAMAVAGAAGFDCGVPGHSDDWFGRPVTDEERQEINRERRESVVSCCGQTAKRLQKMRRSHLWYGLVMYVGLGAVASSRSPADCPATGTVPASGDPHNDDWVPPAEAAPDAAGREYGWRDRFWAMRAGFWAGCGIQAAGALLPLLLLLGVLDIVYTELVAMRRGRR